MAAPDLSPYEAVNEYRKLKVIQTVVIFILFGLGLVVLFLSGLDLGQFVIHVHIFTWAVLVSGVLSVVAVLLLHFGNTMPNRNMLKAFMVFGCLTYSMFDNCAGGFASVRKRIVEIEANSQEQIMY